MNLNQPVILVGVGEMGGVFARALLRDGRTLVPVVRETPIEEVAANHPEPKLVLVTVGEADLDPVLAGMPDAWRGHVGLIQNELLPRTWDAHNIANPTVAAVWFEKKPGKDTTVIIPTPAYGPRAGLLVSALESIGIAAVEVTSEDEMLYEMVRKNLYILTANIGGLITRSTVHDLWHNHRALAEEVAAEIIEIQGWLTGAELDGERLVAGMVEAFDGDPEHGATGRSAPMRLARALHHADEAGIAATKLRKIAASID